MRLHVVYDAEGEVVALGLPLPPAYDGSQPKSGPMALPDQHVGHLRVPEELEHLDLGELATRVRVDTESQPHKLYSREE